MPSTRQKRKSDAADAASNDSSQLKTPEKKPTPRKKAKRETSASAENASAKDAPVARYWLMKAEPETRIVKNKVRSSYH
jgi:hypothetical protein